MNQNKKGAQSQEGEAPKDLLGVSIETFERNLIICLVRSVKFYRSHRDFICSVKPENGDRRYDFQTRRFNHLFIIIDACWRSYDATQFPDDAMLPREQLYALLVDMANKGVFMQTIVSDLIRDLDVDIYAQPNIYTPDLANSISGEPIRRWLAQRRASSVLASQQVHEHLYGPKSLDEMQAEIAKEQAELPPSGDLVVKGGDLFTGSFAPGKTVPTGLRQLDDALGGGYRPGEVTMFAAANGDGKSVQAVQTVAEMIRQGFNVMMVSTEETRRQFTMRLLSNGCQIDFQSLQDYLNPKNAVPGQELPIVPPFVMANPQTARLAQQLIADAESHLILVDWTDRSHSLTGELEHTLRSVERTGFVPDVVIFDWVGGAVIQDRSADSRRLILEEAVNVFTMVCRKRDLVGIIFAQLDKKQSTNKTWVTMSMLSESKTMTNKIHNFVGITGLRPKDAGQDGLGGTLPLKQFFCVGKCRNGPGGWIPVTRNFKYMRFTERHPLITSC